MYGSGTTMSGESAKDDTPICLIQPVELGWLLTIDHRNGVREQHLCASQDEANAKALRALNRAEPVRNY